MRLWQLGIIFLLLSSVVNAQVVFKDDFDARPDWHAEDSWGQGRTCHQGNSGAQGHCDDIPTGYAFYQGLNGALCGLQPGDYCGVNIYEIPNEPNSGNKALVYWARNDQNWYNDGSLSWWSGVDEDGNYIFDTAAAAAGNPGAATYPELWLQYDWKFDSDYAFSRGNGCDSNGALSQKVLRLSYYWGAGMNAENPNTRWEGNCNTHSMFSPNCHAPMMLFNLDNEGHTATFLGGVRCGNEYGNNGNGCGNNASKFDNANNMRGRMPNFPNARYCSGAVGTGGCDPTCTGECLHCLQDSDCPSGQTCSSTPVCDSDYGDAQCFQWHTPGNLMDGNWHTVKIYLKMNSGVGEFDGIVRWWVDDSLLYDWSEETRGVNNGVAWNDDGINTNSIPQQAYHDGFNHVEFGGNLFMYLDPYPADGQWWAMDNIVIATTEADLADAFDPIPCGDRGNYGQACTAGTGLCQASGTYVCDDVTDVDEQPSCNAVPSTGSPETCNGVDDDCNGIVDDGFDADGDGFFHTSCPAGNDCNDNNSNVYPGANDICENGIDEDCSGADSLCICTDADGDGYGKAGENADCTLTAVDCNDNDAAINPGAVEQCENGIDENCDGSDECLLVPQGLLAYYPFEGNANDESTNNNDGTVSGATLTSGKTGQAYQFDGSNDYINVGSASVLDDLETFSYAAWIHPTSSGDREILSKASSNRELRLKGGDTSIQLRACLGSACSDSAPGEIALNQWHHVVMTYDINGDQQAHLYIDGTEVQYNTQATSTNPPSDAGDDQYIGIRGGSSRPFAGKIDEVRIYDRILTQQEIDQLAGASTGPTCSDGIQNQGETGVDCGGPCPACAPTCNDGIQNGGETGVDCGGPCPACPASCFDGVQNGDETGVDCGGSCPACQTTLPSGLVAHYTFENTVNDASGNNHHATNNGASFSSGHTGQAATFDGNNDYITLPNFINTLTDYTFTAWINWQGNTNFQRIFDFNNGNPGANTGEFMYFTPRNHNNELLYLATDSGYTNGDTTTAPVLTTNQWIHVALVQQGNTITLYSNGAVIGTGTTIHNPQSLTLTNFWLGRSAFNDPYFSGLMDEVQFYNRALNSAEVTSIMTGNPTNTQTCAELNGNLCASNEICNGTNLGANDGVCCDIACDCANTGDLNCDNTVNIFDLVRAGNPKVRPNNWIDTILDVFNNFGMNY